MFLFVLTDAILLKVVAYKNGQCINRLEMYYVLLYLTPIKRFLANSTTHSALRRVSVKFNLIAVCLHAVPTAVNMVRVIPANVGSKELVMVMSLTQLILKLKFRTSLFNSIKVIKMTKFGFQVVPFQNE